MKYLIFTALILLSHRVNLKAQVDCYNEGKAQIAKENMDEGDDGLTCANAAKFYVMLCQYKTEPLYEEQGIRLKKQLEAIKKAYNDYGVYCKDIGRILDMIPESPTITVVDDSDEVTTDEVLLDAVNEVLGFGGAPNATQNNSTQTTNCVGAGERKFGNQNKNRSFSQTTTSSKAFRYEISVCHCIQGTYNEKYSESEYIEILKRIRKDWYNNYKSPGDPDLSPVPSKCGSSNNYNSQSTRKYNYSNLGDALVDDQISNDLTTFTNELAELSNNPKIKRLAKDMSAVQQKYDKVEAGAQRIANTFGASIDQETRQMMNFYQNVEMAVAIGKAIFGKEPSLEERLSESQLAVREYMLEISENLRTIYNEVNSIEPYLNQGENYLTILENRKQKILSYNALTVKERYLYLWYLDFNGYPNVDDYSAELNRIEQLKVNQLLREVAKLQSGRDMSNKPHIANMNLAFAKANNQIVLNKMSYYKNNGQKEKAEALQEELTFNVPIGQTISLITESFNQREFYATAQYAQIVQDHFQNEEIMHLYYEDIPGLPKGMIWDSDDEIGRGEVSILMLLGIIAAVETEQFTQAQNALAVLTEFHNNTLDWNQKDLKGGRRKKASQNAVKNVLAMQLTKSHLSLNTAKAYVNLGLENFEKVIENATTAREYLTITSGIASGIPQGLLYKLKIEAYLGLQDYESAKEVFRDWNSSQSNINKIYYTGDGKISYMENTDKDFYNALIRYYKKDYKGALFALQLMKKKMDEPKAHIYLLEENINLALGNSEDAEIAHHNYINLVTKQ